MDDSSIENEESASFDDSEVVEEVVVDDAYEEQDSEPVFDDDDMAARSKRLVKLARLKETYGACLVADLLTRYPEYELDELERDLNNFSYN